MRKIVATNTAKNGGGSNASAIVNEVMGESGQTQKTLASRLGVTRQCVSQILIGKDMKCASLVKMMDALGYDVVVRHRADGDAGDGA